MNILPIHKDIIEYLEKHSITNVFEKKIILFKNNPFHPSLKTELLEPREMRIWSFRLDKKYRAVFIFIDHDTVEIIDVNNHYKK